MKTSTCEHTTHYEKHEARVGIGEYIRFYNAERKHQALGYQTPASFYDSMNEQLKAAA